jgi:peptidoglycan LD-endopeptidase LytH
VRINASNRRRVMWLTFAGLCALVGAILLLNLVPPHAAAPAKPHARMAQPAAPATATPDAASSNEAAAGNNAAPAPVAPAPTAPVPPVVLSLPASAAPPPSGFATSLIPSGPVEEADIAALKAKDLLIPVIGVSANQLRDSYYAGRSEGRTHEALDIMAAGGTPVRAAADGTIVRLFQSDKGGITLYQLDSSGRYIYYYAHLQRYADGISEGKPLRHGDVIAYVGDTGNAGAGNYHLHFAILKPVAPRKWSGGFPINPYPILAGK